MYEERHINESSIRLQGGLYTAEETFTPTLSDVERFYVLEKHKLIIPSTRTAQDSYSLFLSKHGDWEAPELLSSLPSCSQEMLGILLEHTDGFTILPVLRHLLVAKPIVTLTPMQREAMQNRHKHIPFYKKTKEQQPTGTLDLSSL